MWQSNELHLHWFKVFRFSQVKENAHLILNKNGRKGGNAA